MLQHSFNVPKVWKLKTKVLTEIFKDPSKFVEEIYLILDIPYMYHVASLNVF